MCNSCRNTRSQMFLIIGNLKKETLTKAFSFGLLPKFKDTFFHRTPRVATSVHALNIPSLKMRSWYRFLACNSQVLHNTYLFYSTRNSQFAFTCDSDSQCNSQLLTRILQLGVVAWKKALLRNFAKFTGKQLFRCLFSNKFANRRTATLFKGKPHYRCFLVNFAIFFRTSIL